MGLFTKPKAVSLKEFRCLLLSFGLILLLLVLPFILSSVINDISLAVFSLQLERCTLPPKTSVLDHAAVCGKLNGNGNGMDFLAVVLIQSEQPQEELVQYFNRYSFRPAKGKDAKRVVIAVMRAASPDVATDLLEHRNISFLRQEDQISHGNCYYVIIYDGGYSALFDIRGH